jgi:hypothetical protein
MPSQPPEHGARKLVVGSSSVDGATIEIMQFIAEALAGIEWEMHQANITLTKIDRALEQRNSP